jgi:hypothetical protein
MLLHATIVHSFRHLAWRRRRRGDAMLDVA